MSAKQTAVVICPGRGTYNKDELGYFRRNHADKGHILDVIDSYRHGQGQMPVSELDAMSAYNMRQHTAGENASALIYACARGDFEAIDTEQYEIVAVTGNSMGWYIALAMAGALGEQQSIELINTMGSMMAGKLIGGQMIYPVVDENWLPDRALQADIQNWMAEANHQSGAEVYVSIYLGGYLVLGGNDKGLKEMEQRLPKVQDRYPMRLFNHAAFHTPLLKSISEKARQVLPTSLFSKPTLPLIDGQGKIWQPYSTELDALYRYTLDTQVVAPYDYSAAIMVALKEFAPDKLIILGPGATLGGATGQCLIQNRWQGITDKAGFISRQQQDPLLLAMGMAEQRSLVTG
ncbi:acyl carrier protein [Lacimicrobium alkaliphilum]|uniref:[acyl-carrier-protein] S-malonyltransferase n=1 Tax=Lacimicrobium alkaliphilum TaxID=1526571 RepID=A0ABQ1RNN4_9ALTE|nr:acyl carrier protein [Lacimicrobium alkaliphilum]GGD73122.1 acyl carrier protein [Lacimicrobium alkaliphilum]